MDKSWVKWVMGIISAIILSLLSWAGTEFISMVMLKSTTQASLDSLTKDLSTTKSEIATLRQLLNDQNLAHEKAKLDNIQMTISIVKSIRGVSSRNEYSSVEPPSFSIAQPTLKYDPASTPAIAALEIAPTISAPKVTELIDTSFGVTELSPELATLKDMEREQRIRIDTLKTAQ